MYYRNKRAERLANEYRELIDTHAAKSAYVRRLSVLYRPLVYYKDKKLVWSEIIARWDSLVTDAGNVMGDRPKNRITNLMEVNRICNLYQVNRDWLLLGKGEKSRKSAYFELPPMRRFKTSTNEANLELSEKLKAERMRYKADIPTFATVLAMDPVQYARLEAGEIGVSAKKTFSIARALQLRREYLIGDEERGWIGGLPRDHLVRKRIDAAKEKLSSGSYWR